MLNQFLVLFKYMLNTQIKMNTRQRMPHSLRATVSKVLGTN